MPLSTNIAATANMPALITFAYPVTLAAPSRGNDLHVRITAPVMGQELPVIVLSHGHGSSMDGYAPLVDYWASRGFVVVVPTHLDSRRLRLRHDDQWYPSIWRIRVEDIKRILDNLTTIENALPGLSGRVDHTRIAAAGHSFGGQTIGLLLGARTIGEDGVLGEDMSDPRIGAGVLLAAGGKGGADLSQFAREHVPYLNSDFSHLVTPTLVVAGDNDHSPLTVRGPTGSMIRMSSAPAAEAS
jgi:predicted dienelactone hydrolase